MLDGVNKVSVVVAPLPAIPPGFIVHAPAGNPLKATLPVGVVQVGWVIVPTMGAVVVQYVTELSVLVLTKLSLPATSVIVPMPKLGMMVPLLVAVIKAVQVVLSNVVKLETESPDAVPPSVMSALINVVGLIGSLKMMVNETGDVEVGSLCAPLWLMVTVGEVLSTVSQPATIAETLPAISTATIS